MREWPNSSNSWTSTVSPASSRPKVRGVFGDPLAVVITLQRRRKKTLCGVCAQAFRTYYDKRPRRVRDLSCGDKRVYLDFSARRVDCSRCSGVNRERLDWLADNRLTLPSGGLAYDFGQILR